MVQLSHSFMTIGKTIALTRQAFVDKVVSLLFNTLSRFVVTFLRKSKHLLISWLQLLSTVILKSKKIRSVVVSIFSPIYLPWSDAMILVYWMLSFKPAFYSLFSPSSRGSLVPLHFLPLGWYHLYIWGFFICLPAVLIPACDSSSPAFHVMYSAYKLNKQGDSIQPWCTPFPVWNQSLFHVWF